MIAPENWHRIPDWTHYELSSRGRVRSLPHTDRLGRFWPGQILRLSEPSGPGCGGGGLRVTLSDGARRRSFYPTRWLDKAVQR